MELTKKQRVLINDLVNIAWSAGAIKGPQMAQEVEDLRRVILEPLQEKAEEKV